MLIYIILVLILWLVAPIVIDGHIKKKSDRKALVLVCRIFAVVFIFWAIFREFL